VLSLSKHERPSDTPFGKHVLSVLFVHRKAQDERRIEELRLNGDRPRERLAAFGVIFLEQCPRR
jgi:hypothetical protein